MLGISGSVINTYPYIQVKNPTGRVEREATTSKFGEEHLFFFLQREIGHKKAVVAMIGGFCRDVFEKLPLESASEVSEL